MVADNEAALFRLYLEVERDAARTSADREAMLDAIGRRIDTLRASRGLPPEPSIDQLLDHYDGTPPIPPEAVRRERPGATVREGVRVETVGGRLRAFPTVTVEVDGSTMEVLPEPPRRPA